MRIDDIKNKILTLAIQGKLVPQNPSDEPATVLLEKIKAEKEQLIKEKKIKKEKPLSEITEEEKGFEIPEAWEWCRLGEIGVYKKGPFGSAITKSMFVPKSDNAVKVYEQKNAIQKDWTLGEYYVTQEYFESKLKGFEVFGGDIIVSCAGTIGETYIMPKGIERGVINQALMKMNIFDGININYFLMYFECILKEAAKESSKGSAIKNIPPFDIFKKMLFALPPIAEQHRIVSKVEELFKIVDSLGENKEAMLENIAATRNKVLQLAIQGKLVEQEEGDEPASVLLDKIQKEKEQLIKEKKIKKEKTLPEIGEEEKGFEVPKGWEWCRLESIVTLISGRDLESSLCNSDDIGTPYIMGASNMGDNELSIERWVEKPTVIGKKDDVMISVKGTVGKLQVINLDEVHLSRQVMSIRCFTEYITNKYILIYLKGFMEKLKQKSSGVIPGILREDILTIPISLPPLAEQHRIVAKVDELMEYLNQLEKTILAEEII